MGELAYMKVGDIKGPAPFAESDPGQRRGLIPVIHASQQVMSDINEKSGKPDSGQTHTAFVVRKKIDFATPHLVEAHRRGQENPVVLKFFHLPPSGPEAEYLRVTLTRARIIKYGFVMPHARMSKVHEYEDIHFLYESIDWAYIKHPNDPTMGSNPASAKTVMASIGTDWVEVEAEARALQLAGRLADEMAEQLLEKYKAEHPNEFPNE